MKQYIGCDAHARYSVFVSIDEKGTIGPPVRVEHKGRDLRDYLEKLEKDTPVAVEAGGGWYWFMDELEAAGLDARLVDPLQAKHRMSERTRPTSWMPKVWRSCCGRVRFPKSGYRLRDFAICVV